MRILATMPGLFGDVIEACLTVRAIAEHYDSPVHLQIAPPFASLRPLLEAQDYIAEVLTPEWNLAQTGPVYTLERYRDGLGKVWEPLTLPPGDWDRVAHLQYRGWPSPTCYQESARGAEGDLGIAVGTLRVDPAERPWIKVHAAITFGRPVGSWRSEDADKPEFLAVLRELGGTYIAAPGEKVPEEFEAMTLHAGWNQTARLFAASRVWVGNQSAPWVLANAMHMPRILTCERDQRRHDATFWLPTPGNMRVGMNAQEIHWEIMK